MGLKSSNLSVVVSIAALAAACSSAPLNSLPRLPDGQITTMTDEGNLIREGLKIDAVPLRSELKYRSIKSCVYFNDSSVIGYGERHVVDNVSIEAIGDRLYVLGVAGSRKASHVIDRNGHLFDSNTINIFTQESVNSTNKDEMASEILSIASHGSDEKSLNSTNSNVVDGFSVSMPELPNRLEVGVAFSVPDVSGHQYAQYIYRGVTRFSGRSAAVFDLVRDYIAPHIVGFNIVDIDTAMPILTFRSSDRKNYSKDTQISCQP